jgi:hypothetical protein
MDLRFTHSTDTYSYIYCAIYLCVVLLLPGLLHHQLYVIPVVGIKTIQDGAVILLSSSCGRFFSSISKLPMKYKPIHSVLGMVAVTVVSCLVLLKGMLFWICVVYYEWCGWIGRVRESSILFCWVC